jgi:dTDP-4-dehydrorhamnose reductase
MKKNILILGTSGMLGHAIYKYLSKKFSGQIFGTDRLKVGDPNIFILKAETVSKDLNAIIQRFPNIEYIINCIGALKNSPADNMFLINGEFPQKLATLCVEHDIKLIHISTDAVFSPLSQVVTEKDVPSPQDDYGKSKLVGEPRVKNCLTFRTSIIGLDHKNHKGILEWILNNKSTTIPGYTNQLWTGCTTLQFAKLCEDIIINDTFYLLRKLSPTLHFTPLGPMTKYELINDFIHASHLKKSTQEQESAPINRSLQSLYFDYFRYTSYTNDTKKALKELLASDYE